MYTLRKFGSKNRKNRKQLRRLGHSRSFKNGVIRQITHDFLFAFQSNCNCAYLMPFRRYNVTKQRRGFSQQKMVAAALGVWCNATQRNARTHASKRTIRIQYEGWWRHRRDLHLRRCDRLAVEQKFKRTVLVRKFRIPVSNHSTGTKRNFYTTLLLTNSDFIDILKWRYNPRPAYPLAVELLCDLFLRVVQ